MGAENSGFKIAALGFKRADVLACIDRLTAESLAEKQQAEQQLALLRGQVAALQSDNDAMQDRLHDSTEAVVEATRRAAAQEKRAETAERNIDRLTKELSSALVEAKDFKKRLFDREEEAVVLRRDNARMTQALREKQNALQGLQEELDKVRQGCKDELAKADAEAGATVQKARSEADAARKQAETAAQQQVRDVQAQAAATIAAEKKRLFAEQNSAKQQMCESADTLSSDLAAVRRDLAIVEQRIAEVTANLQHSTQVLARALEQTEGNVDALTTKLRLFPEEPPSVQTPYTRADASLKTVAPQMPEMAKTPKLAIPSLSELLLEKLSRMVEK